MNKQTLALAAASFLALTSNVAAEPLISAVKGHKITYVDQGSGPAIVLIHGLGADHARWYANLDKLSETNRVIAPDLLGFGKSDKPDMDYSVSMYVDQIAGLMDNLGIETATLVGSSMGGLISMLFAKRYPKRVERLVLVAPAFVFGLPEAITADMLASAAAPKTIDQMEAYLSRLYANPPTDPEVIEALLAEHMQVNSGGAVASLARSIKSGEATFSDDRLDALKMEALIVHGSKDGIVPAEASRNLASKLANASFHEFSGASLVSGQGFAVDASLISADVQKQNSSNPEDWAAREIDPTDAPRAVREYLDTLDDEAFGAATTAKPKFTAHADPASQRTAARKGPAFFAYSDNYLIDTDHGIIVDVAARRSNKPAEVGAMRKMLARTEDRFGLKPDWIAADTAYGSSDNLVWLALKRQILPFIPVFHCPAGDCAAICREGTKANGPTELSRDPTSSGTMKTTATFARAAKRCGTHGAPTPIQNETRRAGDHANTGPEAQTVEVAH